MTGSFRLPAAAGGCYLPQRLRHVFFASGTCSLPAVRAAACSMGAERRGLPAFTRPVDAGAVSRRLAEQIKAYTRGLPPSSFRR
jgi:hypothetical protein